jgi:hypothetical protein
MKSSWKEDKDKDDFEGWKGKLGQTIVCVGFKLPEFERSLKWNGSGEGMGGIPAYIYEV